MKPVELVTELLTHAQALHPSYTKEQQFTWIAGLIADVVLEKNHLDNTGPAARNSSTSSKGHVVVNTRRTRCAGFI